MFLPNTTCQLYRRTDAQDTFGNYTYEPAVTLQCAVVQLDLNIKKTSVRADSAGSRGRAEEEIGLARILFPPKTQIEAGDIVAAEGEVLEVIRLFPRRSVLGFLDHVQVDFRKGTLP